MPLVVCATPIGNLEDVTLRVLAALRDADAVLCEDTRRTQVLLDRHGIRARRLVSDHRHNEARRVAELVPRLAAGERTRSSRTPACPASTTPVRRLVDGGDRRGDRGDRPARPERGRDRARRERPRRRRVPLPRLPAAPRGASCDALVGAAARDWPYAAVAFESPRRLADVAGAPRAGADPDRPRRGLPRADEALRGGGCAGPRPSSRARFREPPKGEVTLVVGAGRRLAAVELDEAVGAVADLVAAGATRRVAADDRRTSRGRLAERALPASARSARLTPSGGSRYA